MISVTEEQKRELYKRENKRKALMYFITLICIQLVGISLILEFNIKANIPLFVGLCMVLATVLPIVLAMIIFRWPWGARS